MRVVLSAILAGLLVFTGFIARADEVPDQVLEGSIQGGDHQTYRLLPFDVPAGTRRITVEFEYTGRERRTTVDLGLLGPDGFRGQDGFRGWSGGNKRRFTVAATDATPSYLPGPITPGRWSLLLGFPNVRADARDRYTARIWFDDTRDDAPLRREAGWYRGDLHMHDAHSDGGCASQAGVRVPCPLFLTAQVAAQRGLDFIAVTDHNTTSQANGLRELQPYFDRLLLMPGREITTFSGHANWIGGIAPLDFRVGSKEVPDWNAVLAQVDGEGIVSINHPVRPSGEACMGCGWSASETTDLSRIQAVEVVNGADADSEWSGIPFWERQLSAGRRMTAIGGSDNHDAPRETTDAGGAALGAPTTVVHAEALSMPAVLDGIREGRVFVDVQGSRDRAMTWEAIAGAARAVMGQSLPVAAGAEATFVLGATSVGGASAELIVDGRVVERRRIPADGPAQTLRFTWRGDGGRHWVRVNVRGSDGRLWLLGNPIYVEPPAG